MKAKRTNDLVFGLLLAVSLTVFIAPFWIGALAPLTDFGFHLLMADVWARLDKVAIFSCYFERRHGFAPNLLAARFSELVHFMFDARFALRLFISITVVATAMSWLWLAQVFQRSRWLVFLALPFLWGSSLSLGMINYVAVFPLMFLALGLARRAAQSEHWGSSLALGLVCVLSLLAHGLGFIFTVGLSLGMFLISIHDWRRLYRIGVIVPGILLWRWWIQRTAVLDSLAQGVWQRGGWRGRTHYIPMEERASWAVYEAIDVGQGVVDNRLLTLVLICILALILWHVFSLRQRWTGLFWVPLDYYALELTVIVLAAAVWFLPTYLDGMPLGLRLITPCLMLCAMLPRLDLHKRFSQGVMALGIAASLGFGAWLVNATKLFSRQEMTPLTQVLNKIPRYQNVACLGVQVRPVFWRLPVQQACPGLATFLRDAFSGPGFAHTSFNALKLRQNIPYSEMKDTFEPLDQLHLWDYFVVRGSHTKPPALEYVTRAQGDRGPGRRGIPWTLYRLSSAKRAQLPARQCQLPSPMH